MQSIRPKKHVKYFKYFCEFHLLSPWKRPVASSSRAQFFFWNFSNGNDLWWSYVPCWRVHVKIKLVLFYDYNSKQLWKNLARETNCQRTRWKNWTINAPHDVRFATETLTFPWQAWRSKWHSLRSSTPSDAQTGFSMFGQVGHMHCAVLSTTLHPRLYGALQGVVRQGSVKKEVK